MCLMAPARVVSVAGDACEVDIGGRSERVSALTTPDLVVGDWVLVTGGTVVRRLAPEQAAAMGEAAAIAFAAGDRGG